MIILAALALTAAPAAPTGDNGGRGPAVSVRASALATVRLVQSATVRLDGNIAGDPRERDTIIHLDDGNHPAKIVEFE